MNKKTQTILGVLVVVIVAGGVGFYIYKDTSSISNSEETSVQEQVSNVVTKEVGNGTEVVGNGNYSVEIIPIEGTSSIVDIPVPNLNNPVIFGENTSDEARNIITKKIDKLIKELKEDNNLFQDWMELGLYRKMIGDYEGARDAWEYAGAIRPQNSLSFRNLGDLYGYYLKEPKKAEENFLKAIKNAPSQIEYYFKTTEFYREVMKDTVKARKIVEQGIESNESSEELKLLLASLE
jgi:tetratricopeptide (TPR) repeat protein